MRFVIYDDESMEPITVISLRGMTERDIMQRGHKWRVAVPTPLGLEVDDGPPSLEPMRVVDLWFERFVRNGQSSWMCFTRATDLAMLLTPDWLPGQRPAVQYLQDQNDWLTKTLMRAMSF
jgi:hypothetical protein